MSLTSRSYGLYVLFLFVILSCMQIWPGKAYGHPPVTAQRWVDSVYRQLNEEERIGQLFMVAAYSGGKNFNQDKIEPLIRKHQIGGVIFMQGGAGRQANLTNRYQGMAQVPLLISMDAEWGLGMRLDSILNFPRQMQLGATNDTALAYAMGMAVAYQCKRLGVHINFAPVVDVNNNPANPVINFRSFGEDKERVSRMAIAYMRGMQDFGVMACAKHFPGHGDTDADSHKELPVISKSMASLEALELYPFKRLINAGVQSVMVAHLSVPALEKEAHVPTTLSKNTISTLLKKNMGFKGLVFTDALDMKGVAKYYAPGEVDLRAFMAGNDVLLFSQDVPTGIAKIKEAIHNGKIPAAQLEQSVKKILLAKYAAGLPDFKPIDTRNITADINQYAAALNTKVAAGAVTVVRADVTLRRVQQGAKKILYLAVNGSLNDKAATALNEAISGATTLSFGKGTAAGTMLARLNDTYDAVIVGVHGLSLYPGTSYGLDAEQLKFLAAAAQKQNVIVAVMGNAYAVKYVCDAKNLLVGYEDNEWTQTAMIKVIAGEIKPQGSLPVTPPCLK